jgi:hypothetical protein
MTGLIEQVGTRVMNLLFGKQKAVKVGPPGQYPVKFGPRSQEADQQERLVSTADEEPAYQLDFTDASDPEVRPTYGSWDKIE